MIVQDNCVRSLRSLRADGREGYLQGSAILCVYIYIYIVFCEGTNEAENCRWVRPLLSRPDSGQQGSDSNLGRPHHPPPYGPAPRAHRELGARPLQSWKVQGSLLQTDCHSKAQGENSPENLMVAHVPEDEVKPLARGDHEVMARGYPGNLEERIALSSYDIRA